MQFISWSLRRSSAEVKVEVVSVCRLSLNLDLDLNLRCEPDRCRGKPGWLRVAGGAVFYGLKEAIIQCASGGGLVRVFRKGGAET
jgi:hypothetical protein